LFYTHMPLREATRPRHSTNNQRVLAALHLERTTPIANSPITKMKREGGRVPRAFERNGARREEKPRTPFDKVLQKGACPQHSSLRSATCVGCLSKAGIGPRLEEFVFIRNIRV